jgi:hypothetical protein
MPRRFSPCPLCGKPMICTSRMCGHCAGFGPRPRPDADYAMELGITLFRLRKLGGKEKLLALSPDARNLLVRGTGSGSSRKSLASCGMTSRVPGIKSHQEPETKIDQAAQNLLDRGLPRFTGRSSLGARGMRPGVPARITDEEKRRIA